ncbi:MAG: hypothetical protein K5744_03965 [Eubacterium sp.]|jgi:hypothetical protein|uniref:Uncharacterized protein n=1 Tax=Eubacterium cellulosolvens (strain ATCC 43171 / JCM 9499 / 6) TaxID=633697 RepID=I5AUN3_EUBC6|nr:hypothetical protein [Eubacterium sp.]
MSTVFIALVEWSGLAIGAVLALLVTISAMGGGLTATEKKLAKDEDPEHYIVKYAPSGFFTGLFVMLAGVGLSFLIGYFGKASGKDEAMTVAFICEIGVVVAASVIFFVMARRALCFRLLVEGKQIYVHPSFGKAQRTTFDDIRTVKKNGSDRMITCNSLVLNPAGGKKFKVDKTMNNFGRFAEQLDRDYKLPNLTRKAKAAKEEAPEPEKK